MTAMIYRVELDDLARAELRVFYGGGGNCPVCGTALDRHAHYDLAFAADPEPLANGDIINCDLHRLSWYRRDEGIAVRIDGAHEQLAVVWSSGRLTTGTIRDLCDQVRSEDDNHDPDDDRWPMPYPVAAYVLSGRELIDAGGVNVDRKRPHAGGTTCVLVGRHGQRLAIGDYVNPIAVDAVVIRDTYGPPVSDSPYGANATGGDVFTRCGTESAYL